MTNRLARAWAGTVGANGLILVTGILTGILAARLLGPEDRGILAILLFWPGLIAGIGFLSLGEAIVYRRNAAMVDKDRFTATVAVLALILSAMIALAGFALLPWLLGEARAAERPLATAYLVAFVPLNCLALALLALDHAERRFTRYNLFRLGPSWIYLLGILALWASGHITAATLLWASWLGTAITAAARVWAFRRDLLALPAWGEAFNLLKQGGLFHGATVLAALSAQVDRVVVMWYFDDAEVGYYVVALTVATAGLGLVTNSVHTVLFPSLAAEPDRARAIDSLRTGLRRSSLFLIAGTLAALAAVPVFLPVLFGTAFTEAVPVAMVLIAAYAPLALRQIIVRCIRAFGDARSGSIAEAAALAAFIAAVWPCVSLLGLTGVGAALLAANMLALVILCRNLRRLYGLSPQSWLVPDHAMAADARSLFARITNAFCHGK